MKKARGGKIETDVKEVRGRTTHISREKRHSSLRTQKHLPGRPLARERRSTPPVVREPQSKTTVRHHLPPIRVAAIKKETSPDWCGSVGQSRSHKLKGHWFDSWSWHMPGLWVQSLVGVHMKGNQWMFLSRINVSLPPFPSP